MQVDSRAPHVGIDTTRVSLILFDVDIVDEKGRPLPGLTIDDFSVHLDRRSWPIYSVDDMCPATGLAKVETPGVPAKRSEVAEEPSGAPVDPMRVIMYFDFSQLQQNGRNRALKEAERWISHTMRDDDQVMLVGYATPSGLRTMTPFTSDRTRLLGAIHSAVGDPSLIDPFPSFRETRIRDCIDSPIECGPNAWSEYIQGRQSISALQHFTEGLGLVPGRKTLFLFQQNDNLYPGRLFNRNISDQMIRTEELGAAATGSQTVIHPAFVGNSTDADASEATDFGYLLANYTGGRHNSAHATLSQMTDDIRNRASCVYRIGLLPPEGGRRDYYPIRLWVRNRIVADELRVQFLSEKERWLRKARAILVRPEFASDVPLAAALIPIKAEGKFWRMQVQIAVDLDTMILVPSAGGRRGLWEIGALLIRDDGKETWEMLGNSTIQTGEDGPIRIAAVHQKEFTRLRAGSYRLVAFARDVTGNSFGGAESRIDLPDPRDGGIAGPIVMISGQRRVMVDLPLMSQGTSKASRAPGTTIGSIPLDLENVGSEEPLVVSSWICGGKAAGLPVKMLRYLSSEGIPFVRFDEIARQDAGDCYRIDDPIKPRRPAGRYAYHLQGSVDAEVSFEVVVPSPGSSR